MDATHSLIFIFLWEGFEQARAGRRRGCPLGFASYPNPNPHPKSIPNPTLDSNSNRNPHPKSIPNPNRNPAFERARASGPMGTACGLTEASGGAAAAAAGGAWLVARPLRLRRCRRGPLDALDRAFLTTP
jgi:hypothetical protein